MQAAVDALAAVEVAKLAPAHKSAIEQGLNELDSELTAITASTAATSTVADDMQDLIDGVLQIGPHSAIEEQLVRARAEFDA